MEIHLICKNKIMDLKLIELLISKVNDSKDSPLIEEKINFEIACMKTAKLFEMLIKGKQRMKLSIYLMKAAD